MSHKEDFVVECSLIEHSSFNWIKNQFSKAWAASFLSFLHIFFFFCMYLCLWGCKGQSMDSSPATPISRGLRSETPESEVRYFRSLEDRSGFLLFYGEWRVHF